MLVRSRTWGGGEVEVVCGCVGGCVWEAAGSRQALPAVVDGRAALVVDLQVRRHALSLQRLQQHPGTEANLTLHTHTHTHTHTDSFTSPCTHTHTHTALPHPAHTHTHTHSFTSPCTHTESFEVCVCVCAPCERCRFQSSGLAGRRISEKEPAPEPA